jgi:hypothetical protein
MDACAEPLCFGMNLDKIMFLDQKYFEKLKGKFKLLERTYSSIVKAEKLCRSHGKEIKF